MKRNHRFDELDGIDNTMLIQKDIYSHHLLFKQSFGFQMKILDDYPALLKYADTLVKHAYIKHWLKCSASKTIDDVGKHLYITLRAECILFDEQDILQSQIVIQSILSDEIRNGMSQADLQALFKSIEYSELERANRVFYAWYRKKIIDHELVSELALSEDEILRTVQFIKKALHLIIR